MRPSGVAFRADLIIIILRPDVRGDRSFEQTIA